MQNIDRRQALGYIATGAAITTGLISQTAQAQMQFPMPFGGAVLVLSFRLWVKG